MDNKKNFKKEVLPHYSKTLTSVVSLADIAIRVSDTALSETDERRFRFEVEEAHSEIQKAVQGGEKVRGQVDRKTEDIAAKNPDSEIESLRKQLEDVDKQLIAEETEKDKTRDELYRAQAQLLHTTETQDKANVKKAEKETLRNLGYGLLIIPFIGIPMVLSTSKEIKRCEDTIQNTTEAKGKLEMECDTKQENLKKRYDTIKDLKEKRVDNEWTMERERAELKRRKEEGAELFDTQKKVRDALYYLSNLQGSLKQLQDLSTEETFDGIEGIKDPLQEIFTTIQKESFDQELLCDSRIDRKLNDLEEKLTEFNRIYEH
ncbi:centromere-associated protein E-like [Hemiscyllium ocellatum]|uniref:centromere-associated protein E-like n=1 Tax=Hemiscyllium ocellatum TaxID=170820 RepID=UPI002966BC9C|nr:centromere-associated protein E-like [Hemiscyllium ocellatum]